MMRMVNSMNWHARLPLPSERGAFDEPDADASGCFCVMDPAAMAGR